MSNSTLSSKPAREGPEKPLTVPTVPLSESGAFTIIEKNAKGGAQTLKNPNQTSPRTEKLLGRTVTAQDWTGPDDSGNPMNWSLSKKVYHTIIPGVFAFIVTFGSSIYTPGYPEIMARFQVSSVMALLGLSLYVLGLAFGPVLAAPISETFGRRVVYLVSLPLAALFMLGAGFSQNFASLAICRFFAGFFGSPVLAVGVSSPNRSSFCIMCRSLLAKSHRLAQMPTSGRRSSVPSPRLHSCSLPS